MKSFLKVTLISSAIVLALTGCDAKSNPKDVNSANQSEQTTQQSTNTTQQITANSEQVVNSAEPKANSEKVTLSTLAQKESYAFGSSIAMNLKDSEFEIDPEYVISGLKETFNNQSQLSKDEVNTIINSLRERLLEKAKAQFEKEKADNIANGEKFRNEFAKQKGVKKTQSGLLYQVIQKGSKQKPNENDTVIVHYEGTLVDGRKFDSSYDRGQTVTFKLNEVIKGWTEGLQLIGVGGKIKLVIPPELAYGSQYYPAQEDKAAILPNSTLVFEVELLGIDGNNNEQSHPSSKK